MYLLSGIAAVASSLVRARMLRREYELAADPPWKVLLPTEIMGALISVPTGFYMLTSVKPNGWMVALHREGCDIFASPPALLGWVVGEVLAVGSGIRLSVAIVASCKGLEYKLGAALALLTAGIGTTVLSVVVVEPWFKELTASNTTLLP